MSTWALQDPCKLSKQFLLIFMLSSSIGKEFSKSVRTTCALKLKIKYKKKNPVK